MTAVVTDTELISRLFSPSPRGVLGLVDDLLESAGDRPLRFEYSGDRLAVELGDGTPVPVPLPKSVVRAALARIAALCNEFAPNSVTPYRGVGFAAIPSVPQTCVSVAFTNTPDEQALELGPAQ